MKILRENTTIRSFIVYGVLAALLTTIFLIAEREKPRETVNNIIFTCLMTPGTLFLLDSIMVNNFGVERGRFYGLKFFLSLVMFVVLMVWVINC